MKETQQQQNNLLCTGYSVFLFASLFIWLQRMRRNCRNLNIENNENHLCLSVRTKTINIYLRLPIISCPFRSRLCLGFYLYRILFKCSAKSHFFNPFCASFSVSYFITQHKVQRVFLFASSWFFFGKFAWQINLCDLSFPEKAFIIHKTVLNHEQWHWIISKIFIRFEPLVLCSNVFTCLSQNSKIKFGEKLPHYSHSRKDFA